MKLNKTQKEAMVRAIITDLKAEDFISKARQIIQAEAISQLPKELQKHTEYLEVKHVCVRDCSCMSAAVRNNNYQISEDVSNQVKELHEAHVKQKDKLKTIQLELTTLLSNCNTDKQAIQMLPEKLHKYIPKEAEKQNQSTALVTENLGNLISEIGFK